MRQCLKCLSTFSSTSPDRTHCSPECRVRTIAEKFDGTDGCWVWPLSLNVQTGYGQLSTYAERKHKMHAAHRVAYSAFHGPLVRGMHVMHSCDNRACFNPAHLSLGTPRHNVHDMIAKGRAHYRPSIGERHHQAKASDEIVRAIRSSGETLDVLAARYGLSKSATCAIRTGRTWRHVQSSFAAISSDETR
jgi:hypothetical protein